QPYPHTPEPRGEGVYDPCQLLLPNPRDLRHAAPPGRPPPPLPPCPPPPPPRAGGRRRLCPLPTSSPHPRRSRPGGRRGPPTPALRAWPSRDRTAGTPPARGRSPGLTRTARKGPSPPAAGRAWIACR